MHRLRTALLAATLLAGLAVAASDQISAAEPSAEPDKPAILFDPQQLPAFHGKVVQYSLTPRGGVDGFILSDGSQVQLNPHLAAQIVFVAKPGDSVTVHGVKASSGSMILALSVANDAGGPTLIAERPRHMGHKGAVAEGRIKMQLRNRQDEVNGVLLEDGTEIRLWPMAAERIAPQLAPGQTIYARGFGRTTLLGHIVLARAIGPTEAEAVELPRPRFVRWGGEELGAGRPGEEHGGPAGARGRGMEHGGWHHGETDSAPQLPQPPQPGHPGQ
jgi:hypothetical protein